MNSAEFIRYITNPLTSEEMHLLYKAHNINYNKCELYYDFIITLNKLITSTFLGEDVINSGEEIRQHFKWCIKEVFENFKKENILFRETGEIEEYFYHFYGELFYNDLNKEGIIEKLNKLAVLSFDYQRIKTKSDMDVLLELYRLLEKSLNFKVKT